MGAAATASRLLAKFGRTDVILRRPSADAMTSSDRPWAPEDAAGPGLLDPVVAAGISAVVLDAETYMASTRTSALAQGSTAVALWPADAEVPRLGDTFESRGKRYMVLQVDELAPGDETALRTLHLGD